ncbi:MAG: hypothetical protein LBL43_06105 [Treponema sp.]|jgi:hypothetical protein|nr:hypothetical protein [Treponema sp.]
MFDLRISGIAAGAAFILSFLLGLIHKAGLPWLLLRPLIFAVLFFLISAAVYQLVSRFLPELLEGGGETPDYGDESPEVPGSRVNIMEGEGSGPAPAIASDEGGEEGDNLGNISDIIAKGSNSPARERPAAGGLGEDNYAPPLDHPAENRYTGGRAQERVSLGDDAPESVAAVPRPVSPAAVEIEGVDVLPDLDSLAGAFLTSEGEDEDTADYSTAGAVKKPSPGGKGQSMAGDFNPKELAAAIRTKLKREEG